MSKKNFMKQDSLDKFLTIYLKLLDNSIESCKDDMFRDIYMNERSMILAVVDFIRTIDSLSEEELRRQLLVFEQDKDMKAFIQTLTSSYDFNYEPKDNTLRHNGESKNREIDDDKRRNKEISA